MSAGHTILVTGASGNVGALVLAGLVDAGVSVRAADIDPQRVTARFPDVPVVRFDFTDRSTWEAAFGGVRRMFPMRSPQLANIARDMVPALEAARTAGVEHTVLLSLQGARRNSVVPHAKIEAWLRARLGRGSGLTDDIARVTGRTPLSFTAWAHENRDAWVRR